MDGLIEYLKYFFKLKKDKFDNLSDEQKKEIMEFYEKFKEKQEAENKENYIMVSKINL